MEVQFEDLEKSDLIVDCIYKGVKVSNMSAEPFHKLIPRCENAGGFRKKLREDESGKYAYIVLYTSMEELEWPDYLDEETGIFRYYGDNRELTDTSNIDMWLDSVDSSANRLEYYYKRLEDMLIDNR